MFLYLSDDCSILRLTAHQLQFIPKIVLLQNFHHFVDILWERLPEHIKADSEVQQYRRCTRHWNLPGQLIHIDGPAPFINNCAECQREKATVC